MTVRIAMWSGPRNISTALMRSFENRPDATVVDEPFYGHYLARTGADHPGREDVIAAMATDPAAIVADLMTPLPQGRTVQYQKHMTLHMDFTDPGQTPFDWLGGVVNCFLIRAPERVLASYLKARGTVGQDDLGAWQQTRLFEIVRERTGAVPPVLDAEDVLADPRRRLGALCEVLGIPFLDAMLSWPAGPRNTDGVWARHWYKAVEASTGFAATPPADPGQALTADHRRILDEAQGHYDALRRHRLE